MFDSTNDFWQDFMNGDDAEHTQYGFSFFMTQFVNLIKSLFQYFGDLFKYIGGNGPVPEVDPVGE